jgi:glutamine amidotransferase
VSEDLVIIDSGGANIASLLYAFERLDASAILTRDESTIRNARRVILPGVGAARDAMQRLEASGLVDLVGELSCPVLGICLGMQLLVDASEEDDVECLGIIPGVAKRLPAKSGHPVPNMGWCPLRRERDHPLLDGIDDGAWFYFLHSYAIPPGDYTLASSAHADAFSAVIGRGNVTAVQFHPERSSHAGARLLANFLEMPS